jgi:hypothetical protein
MPDWAARILRTLLQLIAGGALTALMEQVARDIPSQYMPYIILLNTLLVTIAQNFVEQKSGHAILKPTNADLDRV